jgi:Flp pilus assembly protein TadD
MWRSIGTGKEKFTRFRLLHVHLEDLFRFWRIFWIDATSAETIELSLRDIADEPEAQTAGTQQSAESVLRWLSRIEHEWLVIFDNADSDPGVVAKYMPAGNRGNILFTSRNPAMGGSSITRDTSLNVENLDQKNAISLLLKSAWLDESSPELRHTAAPIVDALCLLPLAIDQAGAAIKSGPCTINDYLRMYSEHRQRLMYHSSYEGASNYGRAVYATWDLSFAAIEARAAGPDLVAAEAAESAIVILQTFAFFHHDNILEDIIRRAAEAPQKPRNDLRLYPSRRASYDLLFRLLQRRKDGSWDPLFFREGIRILLSFSLIKRNPTSNVYCMHPLVHLWCHDRMSQDERQSRCVSANILLSLSITFQFTSEDYAFRRTLIPHIKANDSREGISIPYDDDQYAGFALALHNSGFWTEAEKLQVQVVRTRTRVLGAEHPDTLAIMEDLASTYGKQGRWEEAQNLIVQVMETRSRVLGAEHPSTLSCMGNLAVMYGDQGRWKEAEKLTIQVMEMMSRILGAEHPNTLTNMGNLGTMYANRGRWAEAEKLQLHAMETSSRVRGADHPATLVYMANLAHVWKGQRRDEEAITLMQRVVTLQIETRGSDHPRTVRSITALNQWREQQERSTSMSAY